MEKCQGLAVFKFCLRLEYAVIDPLDQLRISSSMKQGDHFLFFERPNATMVIYSRLHHKHAH